jgi:hypothetical protein
MAPRVILMARPEHASGLGDKILPFSTTRRRYFRWYAVIKIARAASETPRWRHRYLLLRQTVASNKSWNLLNFISPAELQYPHDTSEKAVKSNAAQNEINSSQNSHIKRLNWKPSYACKAKYSPSLTMFGRSPVTTAWGAIRLRMDASFRHRG